MSEPSDETKTGNSSNYNNDVKDQTTTADDDDDDKDILESTVPNRKSNDTTEINFDNDDGNINIIESDVESSDSEEENQKPYVEANKSTHPIRANSEVKNAISSMKSLQSTEIILSPISKLSRSHLNTSISFYDPNDNNSIDNHDNNIIGNNKEIDTGDDNDDNNQELDLSNWKDVDSVDSDTIRRNEAEIVLENDIINGDSLHTDSILSQENITNEDEYNRSIYSKNNSFIEPKNESIVTASIETNNANDKNKGECNENIICGDNNDGVYVEEEETISWTIQSVVENLSCHRYYILAYLLVFVLVIFGMNALFHTIDMPF